MDYWNRCTCPSERGRSDDESVVNHQEGCVITLRNSTIDIPSRQPGNNTTKNRPRIPRAGALLQATGRHAISQPQKKTTQESLQTLASTRHAATGSLPALNHATTATQVLLPHRFSIKSPLGMSVSLAPPGKISLTTKLRKEFRPPKIFPTEFCYATTTLQLRTLQLRARAEMWVYCQSYPLQLRK